MNHSFQALLHRAARLAARWRAWLASTTGVRLGRDVLVGPGCELALGPAQARRGTIQLGDDVRLERGVLLHPYGGRIAAGPHVFFGPFSVVYGHGGVEIGDETLVSMHCRILSSNHAVPAPGTPIRSQPDVLLPTRIGRDVWLGAGVTVLGGVSIGDGCVVGAGAVVALDLPANSIAVGVPARCIGTRA